MPYCIKDDILEQLDEDTLIQLTDDSDAGVVDDTVIDRAIEDADAEINGYCGARYSIPFLPVPDRIRSLSVDIAVYNICSRRQGAPDHRKERYSNAIKFLEKVADGNVSLGEDDPDATPSDSNKPVISSSTRIFTREKLEGF